MFNLSVYLRLVIGISLFFITLDSVRPAYGNEAEKTTHDIGEVVVVGDKIDDFIKENPSRVVFMDAQEIEKRNFQQVHEVLGSMPGVDVNNSSGGPGTRISIRGGGGSGVVLVLIDGRPASVMQFGGVDLGSIPIDIVKKITVFMPPVPVWLGPGSAAGAVFIETKNKMPRKKSGDTGKIRLSGGSYGLATASATGQFNSGDSQIMISGGGSHKDGRRDNSQKDQGHLSLHYDREKDGKGLHINGKLFVSDHGISGPTYNPTPNARQRYEKASLDMKFEGVSDLAAFTLKGWGDLATLDDTAENQSKSRLDTLSTGLGTDFFIAGASGKNELRLGTQAEHIRVDHTLTGEHDRNQLSAHGEYNIRTAPVVYTLGVRGEYASDFHFSPGGHAGISIPVFKDTFLKANAGYSEQIPSFGQLYQSSHGAMDHVRGNPDLDKEKIISSGMGLDHRFAGKHQFSCSFFRTETRNLIKYERDINNISEPVNLNRAVKQGVETVFQFKIFDRTDIDLSYTWQETENKDTGHELSYAPRHSGKLIFRTQFLTGTRFEWVTRGYADQYSDSLNTETEKLDAYFATDVKLSHPVVVFEKQALVFADIHNLFDKGYAAHFGYPDDGFTFECGMSFNF